MGAHPPRRSLRTDVGVPRQPFAPQRQRVLKDLHSVGPATIGDLSLLGVRTVEGLAECDATELYQRLCAITGARHDPCCEDVFSAAIAQARDAELPAEQGQWWYWSRRRKARRA